MCMLNPNAQCDVVCGRHFHQEAGALTNSTSDLTDAAPESSKAPPFTGSYNKTDVYEPGSRLSHQTLNLPGL